MCHLPTAHVVHAINKPRISHIFRSIACLLAAVDVWCHVQLSQILVHRYFDVFLGKMSRLITHNIYANLLPLTAVVNRKHSLVT